MNMCDYEQYYQKGGTYVLPIELFNELFGEMENWKEQAKKKESNWNSLREWLENEKLQMEGYFDTVLDKMNELERGDNNG